MTRSEMNFTDESVPRTTNTWKVILSRLSTGYPSTKGFASLCIHTLSSIISHNVKDDIRFYPPLDDPQAASDSPANKVLAVPIMSKEDKESQQFTLPRGAIVAINKEGGADFTHEDVENLTQYNCLTSKIFDITTYD